MNNVLAIFKKELRSYFMSPVAYIVIAVFLLLCGFFFWNGFFVGGQASLSGFFHISLFFLSLLVPAITMGLLAEEKRSGTFELLSTMPVTDVQIVVGKYLAAVALLVVALLFSLPYAITVAALGKIDGGATLTAYLGLLLLGSGYMAVGVLMSSLTSSQVVAFILSLVVTLALSLVDKMLQVLPSGIASILEYLGAEYHYERVARGVIDTRDLIYYASLVLLGLYFAARALQRRF